MECCSNGAHDSDARQMGNEKNIARPGGDADSDLDGSDDDDDEDGGGDGDDDEKKRDGDGSGSDDEKSDAKSHDDSGDDKDSDDGGNDASPASESKAEDGKKLLKRDRRRQLIAAQTKAVQEAAAAAAAAKRHEEDGDTHDGGGSDSSRSDDDSDAASGASPLKQGRLWARQLQRRVAAHADKARAFRDTALALKQSAATLFSPGRGSAPVAVGELLLHDGVEVLDIDGPPASSAGPGFLSLGLVVDTQSPAAPASAFPVGALFSPDSVGSPKGLTKSPVAAAAVDKGRKLGKRKIVVPKDPRWDR
jgi:hypothetical protein